MSLPDFYSGVMLGACGAFTFSLIALVWALAEWVTEVRVNGGRP